MAETTWSESTSETDTGTRPSPGDPKGTRQTDGSGRTRQSVGTGGTRQSSDRALAPVGVVLLVGIAMVLAGVVAGAAVVPPESPPTASLSASAANDRITLTHRGGDPLDVRELRLVVAVDGTELDRQPPLPFFSADGFRPGPTGPFNSAAEQTWTVGETASFRVAGTNDPTLAAGDEVEIDVYASEYRIASLSTRVA